MSSSHFNSFLESIIREFRRQKCFRDVSFIRLCFAYFCTKIFAVAIFNIITDMRSYLNVWAFHFRDLDVPKIS